MLFIFTAWISLWPAAAVGEVNVLPAMPAPYAEAVAYEKDKPLNYADFSIVFKGRDTHPKKNAPKVIINRDNFVVTDKAGKETTVIVSSGDLPPPPVNFKVSGKEYRLVTYAMPSGEVIYPKRLAIYRKRK